MRTFNLCVFDQWVEGTDPCFSVPTADWLLGGAERLSFQLVSERASNDPTVEVAVQTSSDGQFWHEKTPAISETLLPDPVVYWGTDDPLLPNLGLARLRVQLSGSEPGARLKVYACGRAEREENKIARSPFTARLFQSSIEGTAAILTDERFNEQLGSIDTLSVQVTAMRGAGVDPRLTVVIEESNDGLHWTSGTFVTDALLLPEEEVTVVVTGLTVSSGLLRMRMSMTSDDPGVPPKANVTVWATGRDRVRF